MDLGLLRVVSVCEKLSNLAILAIERERTQSLDNEKIIDAFAVNHNNRRIALL